MDVRNQVSRSCALTVKPLLTYSYQRYVCVKHLSYGSQLTQSCSSLSFYKEELAGETNNYVHLRAAAERLSPLEVLHRLTGEVEDTAKRIREIIGADRELAEIWEMYLQVRRSYRVSMARY